MSASPAGTWIVSTTSPIDAAQAESSPAKNSTPVSCSSIARFMGLYAGGRRDLVRGDANHATAAENALRLQPLRQHAPGVVGDLPWVADQRPLARGIEVACIEWHLIVL